MEGTPEIYTPKHKHCDGFLLIRCCGPLSLISYVPPSHSDESPAPAANGTQYPEPAEPPYSEPSSGAPEYAQRPDHSAAAAAETAASKDPDGEREDSNASRGAHEAGMVFQGAWWRFVAFVAKAVG